MSFFISHLHDDLRRTRLTRRGATHAAENVPTGKHKAYPRMEQLALPQPQMLPVTLQEALKKRRSYKTGSDTSKLTLAECGTLFGSALGFNGSPTHRMYPSGGALYPIETYLISTTLEGSPPSVFHYNPSAHVLERLWDLPAQFVIKDIVRKPDDRLFSSLIVFTALWRRSSAKYGDFTYPLTLLETGHMSENVLLVANALNMQSRPMAGFDDELLTSLLDLDLEEEQPVHTIILC